MSRERELLEAFFFQAEPLGITLFGPDFSRPLGFGRPGILAVPHLGFTAGFMQTHLENAGLCIFFAKLEAGECLVAQYPFQDPGPALDRAWFLFAHLAAVFTLALDLPSPEWPPAGAPVPKPQQPPSWLRVAQAKPESESDNEPA